MRDLNKVAIRHSALGNRIVLASLGAKADIALETRDAMNEFWQALVSFAFDGKMPKAGSAVEIDFGGGDEQFQLIIKRLPRVEASNA